MEWLIIIIVGALIGWLAGQIMGGGGGLVMNIIIGIVLAPSLVAFSAVCWVLAVRQVRVVFP